MVEAYKKMLCNYVNFNDRSKRSDYWYVVLANFIIGFVLGFLDGLFNINFFEYISYIIELAVLIPGIALTVRRLHDINKSGWYCLVILIPLVGWIWLLVMLCTDSKPENNNYGVQL